MIDDERLPLKIKFLEYFKELPIQKLACGVIGRKEDIITLWKKEDPDFSDQIELAKAEWAKTHARRVKSQEWLLERVMSNHFKERKELDVTLPIPLLGDDDVQKNNSTQETTTTE